MSVANEYAFLKRREREERKKIGLLSCPAAKMAHRQLADGYAQRADTIISCSAKKLVLPAMKL